MVDHTYGWELRLGAVVVETEFTDGDGPGVARGHNDPVPPVAGGIDSPREVYAGEVNAPDKGCAVPAVASQWMVCQVESMDLPSPGSRGKDIRSLW